MQTKTFTVRDIRAKIVQYFVWAKEQDDKGWLVRADTLACFANEYDFVDFCRDWFDF